MVSVEDSNLGVFPGLASRYQESCIVFVLVSFSII